MTSRERLLCALRCGTPDRIPVAPFSTGGRDLNSPLGQRLLRETDLIYNVFLRVYPFQGEGDGVRINCARPGSMYYELAFGE